MYQNTQPLNKTQSLKYSQLNTYTFASDQNFCPVFLQELLQLVREYFICFPNNQTDLPHALLGIEKGVNKYVAPGNLAGGLHPRIHPQIPIHPGQAGR